MAHFSMLTGMVLVESQGQDTVSGHHRPVSETSFKWRFAGVPIVARFGMLTGLTFCTCK